MISTRGDLHRHDEIAESLSAVRSTIPPTCTLIVVTKTFPSSDVKILYQLGERNFGENRDEEGSAKALELPADAIWHFQGQIQSKKIRSIVNWADYIHSLDEVSHAKKISERCHELGNSIKTFIQINLDNADALSQEKSSRGGISPDQLDQFTDSIVGLPGIEIVGVMAVAPLGQDPEPAFERLAQLSRQLQGKIPSATSISAGMSNDYEIALQYGATHIRIGSSILGRREGHL